MPINVSSTKVTWAALYIIAGLVFSSGIAWNTILNNSTVATTQWRYINKNADKIEEQERYVSQIQTIAKSVESIDKSNKALSDVVIRLTTVAENWDQRALRDEKEKAKADAFMLSLSNKVNNIEVKLGRIEAKLN